VYAAAFAAEAGERTDSMVLPWLLVSWKLCELYAQSYLRERHTLCIWLRTEPVYSYHRPFIRVSCPGVCCQYLTGREFPDPCFLGFQLYIPLHISYAPRHRRNTIIFIMYHIASRAVHLIHSRPLAQHLLKKKAALRQQNNQKNPLG